MEFLKLIRIKSWWDYLVPSFLGIFYISIYIFNIGFSRAAIFSGLFLINIIGTASFGYLLNDITDQEEDRKAGKMNPSGQHSSFFNLSILAVLLMSALSAGFFLPKFYVNTVLYISLIFLFVFYSLYPFRLKRFPITGVIIDALYNCTLMALIILTTLYLSSGRGIAIGYPVWILIVIWTFMKGLRGILLHQLTDRSSDRKSGAITFVIRYGPARSLKILTQIIVPVEIGCITFLVILLSKHVPSFYLVLLAFVVFFLAKLNTWQPQKITFRRFRFQLLFTINGFYEAWIPLSILVYLSVRNPLFLILLAFHIFLFIQGTGRVFRDILETIKSSFNSFRSFTKSGGFWFFYPMVSPFHHFFNYTRGALRENYYKKIVKFLGIEIQRLVNNMRFSLRKSSGWPAGSSISRELFEDYNRSRSRGARILLCHAPFSNMYFTSDGRITNCCYNRDFLLGIYPAVDPASAWKGSENRELRNAVAGYDLGKGCFQCRHWIESRNFEAVGARFYDKFPSREEYPVSMEFELSNSCNLECVMCNERYSSRIAESRKLIPAHGMAYDDRFLESLEEFIPHLREAKFLGGEPFFMDIYYRIWEMIIATNPRCIIDVQTNATILNDRVRNLLLKGNFQIGVSIDSLQKEVFESIRKGAHFSTVLKNIGFFKSYCDKKGTFLHISFCPMRANWKEIPQMIEFSNNLNAFIYLNTVLEPKELAIWSLPPAELEEIITCLESSPVKSRSLIAARNKKHYTSFLDQLRSWHAASVLRESVWMKYDELDLEALKRGMLSKVRQHLMNAKAPGNGIATDPEFLIRKFSGVLDRFPETTSYKIGLNEMGKLSLDWITDELIKSSEEELSKQLSSYIRAVEMREAPVNFNIFDSFYQNDRKI